MPQEEEEDSTTKQVARKTWARQWLLRRQEKGAFYTIFQELAMEDCKGFSKFMRMQYAKFVHLADMLNESNFENEFKGFKGIMDKKLANLIGYICRLVHAQ